MNCPFCKLSVHPEAVICPHCHSHLSIVSPLIRRLDELESEVRLMKERLGLPSRDTITTLGDDVTAETINRTASSGAYSPAKLPDLPVVSARGHVIAACTSIALIWVLQAITLFVYDLPPVVFRVLALFTPFTIAVLFFRSVRFSMLSVLLACVVVAVVSVVLMLGLTAAIDKVPMWPESARDWRELFEFLFAIGTGYLAGALLARFLNRPGPDPSGPSLIILLLKRDDKGRTNIEAVAERLQRLVAATAPLATGAVSLYSGLRAFVGGA